NLEYDLWQSNRLKLSFSTELGEDVLKASDSNDDKVKVMGDREISIYSGAKLTYSTAIGIFNTSALYDISGHSEGSIVKVNYSYPWTLTQDLTLIPSVGVNFKSADVANYYYGTSNYDLDSTTDLALNLIVSYQLTKSLNVNGFLRHTVLDNDIANSPAVKSDNVTMAMLSVMYKF
ncbi:MAG: MipA/OmpV family protein, partial [Shewanella sp.]